VRSSNRYSSTIQQTGSWILELEQLRNVKEAGISSSCQDYSRRISEQDGSTNLNRVSKYLGRSKDFRTPVDICSEYPTYRTQI